MLLNLYVIAHVSPSFVRDVFGNGTSSLGSQYMFQMYCKIMIAWSSAVRRAATLESR